MKAVIIGAGSLSVMTTSLLLKRGHQVVIIEQNIERIEALTDELSCGFIHGDGSKPAILKEADPADTDFLFTLTESDRTNIIASMVGHSLGFKRVVTKIIDPEFEHICIELGLTDLIMPSLTIGRFLADMLEGRDLLELSAMIKDEARIFSFVAREQDLGTIGELKLPKMCRVICFYRDEKFNLADDDSTELKQDDEVVILTHSRNLAELRERWSAHPDNEAPSPGNSETKG